MLGDSAVALRYGPGEAGAGGRSAVLRTVTGADEAELAYWCTNQPPAQATTEILARMVRRIGAHSPVTAEDVRRLAIGDRQRLLIALYGATYGRRLDLVVRCNGASCARLLDVDLSLDHLLGTPAASDGNARWQLSIELAGRRVTVDFRVPNGADQEVCSARAAEDVGEAADMILRRAILSAAADDGAVVDGDALLSALRLPLADAFARLDPDAETMLTLACPDCGSETRAEFDIFALLKNQMRHGHDVMADVHRIARAYHWGEAEIMALPISRRRRYLALIAEAMVRA